MNAIAVTALVLAGSATALAQCALQPTATGRGLPSLDGYADRLCAWDPDGAGPLGVRLVAAGSFRLAGDLVAQDLAAFDPATDQWSPLGALDGPVRAFAVLPNNLLVAGGAFPSPAPAGSLLQVWTGSAWSGAIPQPNGLNVTAMAVAPNGELVVACGGFTATVQRFGPTGWQLLGTAAPRWPGFFAAVHTLAFDANGDLLVGGEFGAIDGIAAASIARWNGSTWAGSGPGVDGIVRDLLVTSTGELFAGGLFAVGAPLQNANVAQWNGSSWQSLGAGTLSTLPLFAGVWSLAEVPGGIAAGGQFEQAGSVPAYKVAHWNGSVWAAMGGGIERYGPNGDPSVVHDLQRTTNGELFAAGNFGSISGRDGQGLARWNGAAWRPLRPVGIGAPTTVVHRTANGDVYLGGPFRDIDGVPCNGIARRVGNGWQPLGSGIGSFGTFGFGPAVAAIASLPNGDLVVGGQFPSAGGVVVQGLARWDGVAWGGIGSGLSWPFGGAVVEALHVDGTGDLLVAGVFDSAGGVAVESLARWDGSQWSAIGSGLATAPGQSVFVEAVTTSPLGDVYASGVFAFGGPSPLGKIVVWSGGNWQLLGTTDGRVEELLVLPNGDLLAAGAFQSIAGVATGCVARWSNGVWSSVGSLGVPPDFGAVESLSELPGGDLLAGGFFGRNGTLYAFARWDGVAWTLFDDAGHVALDLAIDPNGEVLVAGNMRSSGGVASANFLRLVPPCSASAIAGGAGCAGSGGANVLGASGKPWLGTIFVANASGVANNSVAMTVLGLGTLSLPLPSLLPQGGAGCELLVTPDALGLVVPSGGQALVPLALPLVPSLVGGVLHLQVVPIEFGAGGAITSVTSTNRLSLVLGIF
jgi:hypothetical protein